MKILLNIRIKVIKKKWDMHTNVSLINIMS